jgi:5-deoxy-glucuronate isomerase
MLTLWQDRRQVRAVLRVDPDGAIWRRGRCELPQTNYYDRQPGYHKMFAPGEAGLRMLEFGLLRVPRDETYRFRTQGHEVALVLLSGACDIKVASEQWSLERVSVFADPPIAAYVPRHREYSVTGIKPADVAVFSAAAMQDYLPRLITPDQVKDQTFGGPQAQRRSIVIMGPEFAADRLMIGETFNEPGEWSSYPPHKHDVDDYPHEVRLEDVSFYQIDPPQGFGLQYIYSLEHKQDEVFPVRNDEAVAIPHGYHPVAAAPGYRLYYLWGLAGDGRFIRSSVDPNHAWVEAEAGVQEPVAVAGQV